MLADKSFQFAVQIVLTCRNIRIQHKEYDLTRQLLKAGTSIGANLREAAFAQSKADFISKLSIALKESSETQYWLELLTATGYLVSKDAERLFAEVDQLIALLVASINTAKK